MADHLKMKLTTTDPPTAVPPPTATAALLPANDQNALPTQVASRTQSTPAPKPVLQTSSRRTLGNLQERAVSPPPKRPHVNIGQENTQTMLVSFTNKPAF